MQKLVLLSSFLFLYSCVAMQHKDGGQGIIGEVRWIEGNLMPSIGDTCYASRAEGVPIEREIYVYKATQLKDVEKSGGSFYTSIHTQLIKKVKSKKDGSFRVPLPSGKYSLFIVEEEGFFANTFDGDNYINPVTVQPNNFTEIKIRVNYKAFY
jgi:hypothetical protein